MQAGGWKLGRKCELGQFRNIGSQSKPGDPSK